MAIVRVSQCKLPQKAVLEIERRMVAVSADIRACKETGFARAMTTHYRYVAGRAGLKSLRRAVKSGMVVPDSQSMQSGLFIIENTAVANMKLFEPCFM